MKTRLLRLVALSCVLAPNLASAVGFGDILLHSRIGEPLLAEVSLILGEDNPPDAACISLKPPSSEELPGISSATIRLVRQEGNTRLLITSDTPVLEPIVVLGVKIGCNLNLERQYLLMPPAPLDPGSGSAMPGKAAPPTENREHRARDERPPKASPKNPALPEDTRPKPGRKPAASGDRLLLSLPSEASGMNDKRAAQPSRLSEMRVRVEKLERSLTLLNRELDSMHAIISETVEQLDAPVNLQMSRSIALQPAASSRPSAAIPQIAPAALPESSRWHELLISALLGGGIAIGVAHLLARRRENVSPR